LDLLLGKLFLHHPLNFGLTAHCLNALEGREPPLVLALFKHARVQCPPQLWSCTGQRAPLEAGQPGCCENLPVDQFPIEGESRILQQRNRSQLSSLGSKSSIRIRSRLQRPNHARSPPTTKTLPRSLTSVARARNGFSTLISLQ
jgi:hypothetical protein